MARRAPDPPAPNRYQLVRCSHLFASSVREALEEQPLRRATPLPLTLSQFHLLKLIARNGRHQVGQVADFLGVSAPAATRNVDKLERLGLLARVPSQGDRRATLLAVSPKARRLVRDYERAKRERLAPVLASFQPEEIHQLSALLERFAVALYSRERNADGACLRCAAYLDAQCPIARARGHCPYREPEAARGARAEGDRA
jgi:DNA-binding MarR family transcriptional regulator